MEGGAGEIRSLLEGRAGPSADHAWRQVTLRRLITGEPGAGPSGGSRGQSQGQGKECGLAQPQERPAHGSARCKGSGWPVVGPQRVPPWCGMDQSRRGSWEGEEPRPRLTGTHRSVPPSGPSCSHDASLCSGTGTSSGRCGRLRAQDSPCDGDRARPTKTQNLPAATTGPTAGLSASRAPVPAVGGVSLTQTPVWALLPRRTAVGQPRRGPSTSPGSRRHPGPRSRGIVEPIAQGAGQPEKAARPRSWTRLVPAAVSHPVGQEGRRGQR